MDAYLYLVGEIGDIENTDNLLIRVQNFNLLKARTSTIKIGMNYYEYQYHIIDENNLLNVYVSPIILLYTPEIYYEL